MQLNNDYFEDISYFACGNGRIKAIIITEEFCRNSVIEIDGQKFAELYNYSEPYDFFTHVFLIPENMLTCGKVFRFKTENSQDSSDYFESLGETGTADIIFDTERIHSYTEQYELNDSGIIVISKKETKISDAIGVTVFDCKDKRNAPVKAFMFTVETNGASFYTGTPFDGYDYINKKQTVEGEARAAADNGIAVAGAVNADFFDMFGDCRPSGLCIKNGITVANADSDRPYFAVLKNGRAVITSPSDNVIKTKDILHAVSGRPLLMKKGEITEFQALEPFGFTRHPRTAVGLRADGTVLVLIIDGRLPDYSNGATLLDTALFLKLNGASDALNLDGGGSCTFLVRNGEGFEILNKPADLFRPADKLIRDVFDSLLIVEK